MEDVRACGETREVRSQHFQSAGIQGVETGFTGHQVQRRALLRAGLREQEAAVRKIESGKTARPRHLDAAGAPMQASRDHEVQHQPKVVIQANSDTFADPPELAHRFSFGARKRRGRSAQQKRTGQPHVLQRLAEDALFERFDVDDDVGEFRHGSVRGAGRKEICRAPPHGTSSPR